MKRFILAILLVLGLASAAWADAFQFVNRSGALLVGAAVYCEGRLVGYTNVQGIIFINAPAGSHRFTVVYMGHQSEFQLNITGNPQLQEVRVP